MHYWDNLISSFSPTANKIHPKGEGSQQAPWADPNVRDSEFRGSDSRKLWMARLCSMPNSKYGHSGLPLNLCSVQDGTSTTARNGCACIAAAELRMGLNIWQKDRATTKLHALNTSRHMHEEQLKLSCLLFVRPLGLRTSQEIRDLPDMSKTA